jgi:hypothetical protein
VGLEVAGDDPQQGGLAGAVRADEGGDDAVPDPERDVVQQGAPVRQRERDPVDVDMAHAPECAGRGVAASPGFLRP